MDVETKPDPELVAAAQLRLFLDQQFGRHTPQLVRDLAEFGSQGPPRPPGLIIQARLAELGITEAEGARRVGVAPQRFNSVVAGHAHISTKFAYRLDQALGIEPLPLLYEQDRWELAHLANGTWPYPPQLGDDDETP